ncbi:MAG: hypothetical protein C0504_17900 [Candidatus Solibacter sp.]|nr:hypothetical protein [Candidatus Solibacter sp.]
MEWTLSDTIALAAVDCSRCGGYGIRDLERGGPRPCSCVFRAIFRICYAKFQQCVNRGKWLTSVTLEASPKGGRRITWGRKNEEFIADFLSVTRRTLDPFEYRLFTYHYLLGAGCSLCTRRLGVDRGAFFHAVYRIQEKLGRTYRELRPYSLFPIDEYFHGRTENTTPVTVDPGDCVPIRGNSLNQRIKVPIKRAA